MKCVFQILVFLLLNNSEKVWDSISKLQERP